MKISLMSEHRVGFANRVFVYSGSILGVALLVFGLAKFSPDALDQALSGRAFYRYRIGTGMLHNYAVISGPMILSGFLFCDSWLRRLLLLLANLAFYVPLCATIYVVNIDYGGVFIPKDVHTSVCFGINYYGTNTALLIGASIICGALAGVSPQQLRLMGIVALLTMGIVWIAQYWELVNQYDGYEQRLRSHGLIAVAPVMFPLIGVLLLVWLIGFRIRDRTVGCITLCSWIVCSLVLQGQDPGYRLLPTAMGIMLVLDCMCWGPTERIGDAGAPPDL